MTNPVIDTIGQTVGNFVDGVGLLLWIIAALGIVVLVVAFAYSQGWFGGRR
jgi:hypothetical protein